MANPNTIPFLHYQDIHIDDQTLRTQFMAQFSQGNYAQALQLLDENENQLEGKVLRAEALNYLISGINTIQNLYYNAAPSGFDSDWEIMQAEIDDFLVAGEWSNTEDYETNNFVYDSDHKWYMCIADATSGTPLTDTTKWLFLDLTGEQGTPGINVTLKYDWDDSVNYQLNDATVYDGKLWVALQNNTNVTPGTDNSTWIQLLSSEMEYIHVGSTEPSVKHDNSVWFQTDVDISTISDTEPVTGVFKRYIAQIGSWEEMYPFTPFTQVSDKTSYKNIIANIITTIPASGWTNNRWTYTDSRIGGSNSIVEIVPGTNYSENERRMYNSLDIEPSTGSFVLTTNLVEASRVEITIRILIIS